MGDPSQPSVRSSTNEQPGAAAPHVVLREAGQAITDLVLFAPLGFLKRARTLLPELVREGKATAASAQMIGKFAVPLLKRQGEKVVKRSIADLRAPSSGAPTSATAPATSSSEVSDTASDAEPASQLAAEAARTASNRAMKNPKNPSKAPSSPQSRGAEPFAGYDLLGSAAVVARLGELTQRQRSAVRAYELAHRNRRTVLGRIDQLASTSPSA